MMLPEKKISLVKRCAVFVGMTSSEVLSIARTAPIRYKVYEIRKKAGGVRIIAQPSRELKQLQYFFLSEILPTFPVHQAAVAYVAGSSIRQNAERHLGSRVILKLDFTAFFPSIRVIDWYALAAKHFADWTAEDLAFSAQVLFFGLRTPRPIFLSIGAPTSPAISNAMMYPFDVAIADFCDDNDLTYTRYADDITISSAGYIDQQAVMARVEFELERLASPRLKLNARKTLLFSKRDNRTVTGLVLSSQNQVSLGRSRKREISAMIHRATLNQLSAKDLGRLKGLLAFALDAEPAFVDRMRTKYGAEEISRVLKFINPHVR